MSVKLLFGEEIFSVPASVLDQFPLPCDGSSLEDHLRNYRAYQEARDIARAAHERGEIQYVGWTGFKEVNASLKAYYPSCFHQRGAHDAVEECEAYLDHSSPIKVVGRTVGIGANAVYERSILADDGTVIASYYG